MAEARKAPQRCGAFFDHRDISGCSHIPHGQEVVRDHSAFEPGMLAYRMVTTVYCDDAGFTGDNLLNQDQPFFAYSAVAIENENAAGLITDLRRRFEMDAVELKGRELYKRGFAPELLDHLTQALGDRVSIAINHKLFSLAAKFFEYVYEPLIAPISSFFYTRGTHLYVSTALWAYLSIDHPTAQQVAQRFEAIMRRRASQEPMSFDLGVPAIARGEAIEPIIRFAAANRDWAMEELESLADENGRIKFVLDLSFSSAKSVLATLGDRFGPLDVIMDASKPLESFASFFNGFIGRSETLYMELRGRRVPMTFELNRPLRFRSSKEEPGLQIADMFASFATLAARDRGTPRGAAMMNRLAPLLDGDSVLPDLEAIDLKRKEAIMNMCLVSELADRSEAGESLLAGIDAYYERMSYFYDLNPPNLGLVDD